MSTSTKPISSRPLDPSLEAYKEWIKQTTAALGMVEDGITEAEWRAAWLKFWGYEPDT